MARDRERGRAAQRQAAVDARVQDIFREARAWYFRGVLALLAAIPLAFVSYLLTAVLVGVLLWCVVRGTRIGIEGERLRQDQAGA